MRYSFSGHESFHCKSLWLKKGYDFICNKKHFADTDSVVELGVGKNMVSAIRYWLKAFSLTKKILSQIWLNTFLVQILVEILL